MNSLFSATAGATVRWHDLPGSGLPVVFIHGLGCAASYEYPRIIADAAFGHRRAILIDLPGSGFSDKPRDYAYTTTQQATIVVEILDSLNIATCNLYGHSMGGSIAIEAADMLGERVHTLAVSEPNFHSGGGFFSRQISTYSDAEFTSSGFAQIVAQEERLWKGSLQLTAPWALWRAATGLVADITPSWMDRFLSLGCEKTLIFGARSLPDADVEAVASVGIPLNIIPDAGHALSWGNPSALAEVLGQVFAQTRRGLQRYPAKLGELMDPRAATKSPVTGRFTAAERHLSLIMHGWAVNVADPRLQVLRDAPCSRGVPAVHGRR